MIKKTRDTSLQLMSPHTHKGKETMTHDGRDAQVLLCPKCKFNYIKILTVNVTAGPRPLVLAGYRCEGCQGGTLKLDFHKGQTFIEEA